MEVNLIETRRAYLVGTKQLTVQKQAIQHRRNELLIKVAACGLCNWELGHYHGLIGQPPMTLGHEWVGEIVAIGDDVDQFQVGDIVTGLPREMVGFSDYLVAEPERCFKIAPHIPPEHALGEPLKCIVTVLRGAAPEAGDYGVVFGAGPMGLWCVQALAGSLLSGLIVVDIDENRLALAKSFGATHVINAKHGDTMKAVQELTDGHMADFVIEGTGNTQVLNDATSLLKRGRGRLVLMSSYKGIANGIDMTAIISRGIEIRAAHPGYAIDQLDDLRRAVTYINNGVFRMDSIITHQFPLADIQEAFVTLDTKPTGYMKGIVIP